MKPLVVGLGNDLLADDAVGILVARELACRADGRFDVIECSLSGLSLLDVLVGYDRSVIIDAIRTEKVPVGTIIEVDPQLLRSTANPSPHYAGLPEVIKLADQLRVDFPKEIRIFAMEVADSHTIGGGLSEPVAGALGQLVGRVSACLDRWESEGSAV